MSNGQLTEVNLRKQFSYIIKDDQLQFQSISEGEQLVILVQLGFERQIFWQIVDSQLVSFCCTDIHSTKITFQGEESVLLNLKKELSNKVMFGNVKKIYGDAKKIGQGGQSEVFLVRNLLKYSDQLLAVKVIDKTQQESQRKIELQGLMIEICNMRKLDHPNIIKLHEVYEGDQKYYMVLDYLAGGSLSDLLMKHQQIQKYISYDKIKKILRQIVKGLIYLHETADMMHRDLKPENILFLDNAQDQVKIVDFGLATECSVEQFHFSRCGTPGYIAPCIANYRLNQKKYTKQCDIFSLGAIFFKMITLQDLFCGLTPYQILKENQACKMNLAVLALLGIPNDAQNLLKRMLDINPQTRINAREILHHPFLQDQETIYLQPHQRKSLFQNLKLKSEKYSILKDQKILFKESRCNNEIFNTIMPTFLKSFDYQINNNFITKQFISNMNLQSQSNERNLYFQSFNNESGDLITEAIRKQQKI